MPNSNGSKKVEIPYKFKTMQLADLKVHPDQADVREISDDSLEALSKHIEKVGLVEEIIINKRTGHIVSGHQRRRVLLTQGYTTARIKVVDVTRKTENMMFINMNSQAISGSFTAGAIDYVMALEAKLGTDVYQDVGLQMLEVELGDGKPKQKEGLTDPDAVPATPKKAITKLGDLYQLGNHRLLCGDATKAEDVERLMDGQKADMVFTDPPYGIDVVKGHQVGGGDQSEARNEWEVLEGERLLRLGYMHQFMVMTSRLIPFHCLRLQSIRSSSVVTTSHRNCQIVEAGLYGTSWTVWRGRPKISLTSRWAGRITNDLQGCSDIDGKD
jgi:16S rRNA G966 N2-methylase RsmD